MKDIISSVETTDGLFHDGDPSTSAEGTVVYAKWLNAMQGVMIDTQTEHKNILAEVGMKLNGSRSAQLLAAIKAIAAASLSHAVSSVYSVGVVVWFAENKDPNTLFPGTKWDYIGENRTIRLAKKDGSDVKSTGGSDTVKLTMENSPPHAHTFNGSTCSFDHGSRRMSDSGEHTHNSLAKPNITNINTGFEEFSGGHAEGDLWNFNSGRAGNHYHDIYIGEHSHPFSGTTSSVGSSRSINLINTYIKLMGLIEILSGFVE